MSIFFTKETATKTGMVMVLGEITTTAHLDYQKIVRDLEPVILRHAATAEVSREMAPEIMSALIDSGLLRMWIPKALGGLEVAPIESLNVMESGLLLPPGSGW